MSDADSRRVAGDYPELAGKLEAALILGGVCRLVGDGLAECFPNGRDYGDGYRAVRVEAETLAQAIFEGVKYYDSQVHALGRECDKAGVNVSAIFDASREAIASARYSAELPQVTPADACAVKDFAPTLGLNGSGAVSVVTSALTRIHGLGALHGVLLSGSGDCFEVPGLIGAVERGWRRQVATLAALSDDPRFAEAMEAAKGRLCPTIPAHARSRMESAIWGAVNRPRQPTETPDYEFQNPPKPVARRKVKI